MPATDATVYVARNPENWADAHWFPNEESAFESYCDWGHVYTYTAFNDAEGWSRPLDDEFADRVVPNAFDRAASRADAPHQASMEGVA